MLQQMLTLIISFYNNAFLGEMCVLVVCMDASYCRVKLAIATLVHQFTGGSVSMQSTNSSSVSSSSLILRCIKLMAFVGLLLF
jgi:hypothetical protein